MTHPTVICLPTLDGTFEATTARLDAWLSAGETDALEGATSAVQSAVEEALTVASALGAAEDCDNEACTRTGDVEYLKDELGKAIEALYELDAQIFEAQAAQRREAS